MIALHQAGIENAVASAGTALATEQLLLILKKYRHHPARRLRPAHGLRQGRPAETCSPAYFEMGDCILYLPIEPPFGRQGYDLLEITWNFQQHRLTFRSTNYRLCEAPVCLWADDREPSPTLLGRARQ